ncbi:odorant receptor 67d-like [Toxorhynchites rutilus septentrionalis]|uniref:odorant receptor 67d-like n=1 Tax=Toxorhynchites rutilus septentrionalis TaxID=329112 RepID=UPI00247A6C1A|nr:odorant receptor 67d-like [Toxorhynchites rutilus septentrionalis]
MGAAGLAFFDGMFMTYAANLIGYVEVFRHESNELNEMLVEQQRENSTEKKEMIREKLRHIQLQHQDIIHYECNLRDKYFYVCFTHVTTSVVGITVALSLVYLEKYVPCYAILGMFMVQLLVFCVLGTILTLKNEDMITILYDINWYMLEKPEKMDLLHMLHRSQNVVELSVGGLTPMNMIMKRIYSYFMMLVNFVN